MATNASNFIIGVHLPVIPTTNSLVCHKTVVLWISKFIKTVEIYLDSHEYLSTKHACDYT